MTEPPIVATGHGAAGRRATRGMVVRRRKAGTVTYVDSTRVIIDRQPTIYELRKFVGLNERTCLNQKPIVQRGPEGQEGPDHRRRRRAPTRASWPWAATSWSPS